jgi:hypothetical protein
MLSFLEGGLGQAQAWMSAFMLAYYAFPDDMSLKSDGGMILTEENRRTRRKTCPSATLSTTNPTWIDPGLHGEGR